jgi:hypothetical protein
MALGPGTGSLGQGRRAWRRRGRPLATARSRPGGERSEPALHSFGDERIGELRVDRIAA